MYLMAYVHCHVSWICEFEYFQDVLLMVFDTTLLTAKKNRRTQNSGVMAEGSHDEDYINFYGQLKEIIELQYNSDLSNCRTVVLFRCDWFDTNSKKSRMKDDGYF